MCLSGFLVRETFPPGRMRRLYGRRDARATQKISRKKYPREIEFVKELPQTISGKTRRVELRNRPAVVV
jgi:acyl-coenzyme A synthetase/AMP-(fatty) acid ligase